MKFGQTDIDKAFEILKSKKLGEENRVFLWELIKWLDSKRRII